MTTVCDKEANVIVSTMPRHFAVAEPMGYQPTMAELPVQSPPQRPKRRSQLTIAELAELGIKVRDFGFEEHNLPPIRPYVARPFNATARTPVRLSQARRPLEREYNALVPLYHGYDSPAQSQSQSQQSQWHTRQSQSQSQPRKLSPESQDTEPEAEPYVDTPLVTPNGSLNWGVKGAPSASQSQSQSLSRQPDLSQFDLRFQIKDLLGAQAPNQLEDPEEDLQLPIVPQRSPSIIIPSSTVKRKATIPAPLDLHNDAQTLLPSPPRKRQKTAVVAGLCQTRYELRPRVKPAVPAAPTAPAPVPKPRVKRGVPKAAKPAVEPSSEPTRRSKRRMKK